MIEKVRALLVWIGLAISLGVPIAFAATSEYLAWRDPVYIAAGLAGVVALEFTFIQPLLARGWLPGVNMLRSRRLHRWAGAVLVAAVIVHVTGLWATSPPDIVDALLLRSPTPFALWGVIAMWALFAAALLAVLRRRLSQSAWRVGHTGLATIAVLGGAAHALLIEGTMEPLSKAVLCGLAVGATLAAVVRPRLRQWRRD